MTLFISNSPIAFGIASFVLALLYFFLMTVNPNLPPALVFSMIIGYFVYSIKTGAVQSIPLPKITYSSNQN